jgi:MYXO-CTERM domain-containing protein
MKRVLMAAASVALTMGVAHATPVYITSTWSDQSVHFLDSDMNSLSSFAVSDTNPNGITTDGNIIWTGHFSTNSVVAYDLAGNQLFSWSDPGVSGLQGLAYINSSEIAAMDASGVNINFFDPFTGSFVRSFAAAAGTVEGLAYDGGNTLYQLDSGQIVASDVNTGSTLFTLANPASGDPFGGTGINYDSGMLVLGSANGNWYKIDALNGTLLDTGNNGLTMYGLATLTAVPAPGALALLGLAGLVGARRRRN